MDVSGGGVVLGEEGFDDGLDVGEGGGDDSEDAVEIGLCAETGGEGHFCDWMSAGGGDRGGR